MAVMSPSGDLHLALRIICSIAASKIAEGTIVRIYGFGCFRRRWGLGIRFEPCMSLIKSAKAEF